MSAQPAVLQVVIMRDGLLVGTEVFVPGQYTLGSGLDVDLRLDDASVAPHHAVLHFQNGRSAIQDAGAQNTFVNGHRVTACEVRPVDEIAVGPFTLKVRVMTQKPATRGAPSPDVAALLGGPSAPQQPQQRPPAPAPIAPAPQPPPSRGQPAATVVSTRRMNAAPQPTQPVPVAQRAPHLHAVPNDEEVPTEAIALGREILDVTNPGVVAGVGDNMRMVPLGSTEQNTPFSPGAPTQQVRAQPHPPAPQPAPHARAAPAPARKGHAPKHAIAAPTIPSANEGKGRPHLFVEMYWGDVRKMSRSFSTLGKLGLVASPDDNAPLPLYGFGGEAPFTFAEQNGELFRVYVPAGAAVERRAQDGKFYPVQVETLETGTGGQRCITLGTGHAVRFTTGRDLLLMAYVQPAIPRPFSNPLKGLPWLMLAVLAVLLTGFGYFVVNYAEMPQEADFDGKKLNPVAVRLIAPPKPEEKKKIEEKIKKLKKEDKKPEEKITKVEKALPKAVAPETKKVLKSVEKLAAAGPAMKDLLAAVDKLGGGPGAKNAKNDFKLSGLIGKAPIANAGLGSFGIGGGGGGGAGIKGAEILRGKGGGGIGALGAGNIGKGAVAGTVTRAATRNIGAQGTIDKEAVAKVINSHLHEVSSCYERALLKTPGLAGKIVLEWQITTTGTVGYAKTKSSSMQSPAVESCILQSLKTWHFPQAKGAGVVITYPFMFNSVGY